MATMFTGPLAKRGTILDRVLDDAARGREVGLEDVGEAEMEVLRLRHAATALYDLVHTQGCMAEPHMEMARAVLAEIAFDPNPDYARPWEPCHACGNPVEDTMARCMACGYDGNLGRFTDEDAALANAEAIHEHSIREHNQSLDAQEAEREERECIRDHAE